MTQPAPSLVVYWLLVFAIPVIVSAYSFNIVSAVMALGDSPTLNASQRETTYQFGGVIIAVWICAMELYGAGFALGRYHV